MRFQEYRIKIRTGAPVNPMRGTLPSSFCLVRLIASPTYLRSLAPSGLISLLMSAGVLIGSGKTGPCKKKKLLQRSCRL